MRLSVDDGCRSDARIADLAAKYEMECIFYWPVEWHSLAYDNGYEPLDLYEAIRIASKFEIGSHTITHRHLTNLDLLTAEKEIIYSKFMLEGLFSQRVTKFAPPRGYTNKDLDGIVFGVYDSQRLTKGKQLVHIHPNSGANGNKPWRECITDDTEELWGHSWEFDKFNMWQEIEDYLRENTLS